MDTTLGPCAFDDFRCRTRVIKRRVMLYIWNYHMYNTQPPLADSGVWNRVECSAKAGSSFLRGNSFFSIYRLCVYTLYCATLYCFTSHDERTFQDTYYARQIWAVNAIVSRWMLFFYVVRFRDSSWIISELNFQHLLTCRISWQILCI